MQRSCLRCGRLFTGAGARCYSCEPRAQGRERATSHRRGYDAAYRAARAQVIGLPCALGLPGCTRVATTADHVVPVSLGGRHGTLRPACAHCNSARGARTLPISMGGRG